MSDASIPHCLKCNEPQYACTCDEGLCIDCGCELNAEAKACGRDMCFACYCEHEGREP
jgi:hypothetical protein